MSEKKETWSEYFKDKKKELKGKYNIEDLKRQYLTPEMLQMATAAALRRVNSYYYPDLPYDPYLGLDYIDYDKQVNDYMNLHPEATKEEIDLLFPNPLGAMKKRKKRKKRKSNPSNMTTSKSSTSKSSKNKKGEKKKKKDKRTRNRRNNYTKRRNNYTKRRNNYTKRR